MQLPGDDSWQPWGGGAKRVARLRVGEAVLAARYDFAVPTRLSSALEGPFGPAVSWLLVNLDLHSRQSAHSALIGDGGRRVRRRRWQASLP